MLSLVHQQALSVISTVILSGSIAGGLDFLQQPAIIALAADVCRKQVNRDAEPAQRPLPRRGEAQCLALDEARQPFPERCRGGPGEELFGVAGDRTAGESLGAGNRASAGVDDRLEQQLDLFMGDRRLEHQVTHGGDGRRRPGSDPRLPQILMPSLVSMMRRALAAACRGRKRPRTPGPKRDSDLARQCPYLAA